MSRADVEELLMAVDESINSLKGYNKITKVKFKSILEHLRSSLDFIAKDINDKLSQPKERLYFPYGKDKKSFEDRMAKNLKGLDVELPSIYRLISELQPHQCADDWLITMCSLTNTMKHKGLEGSHELEKLMEVAFGGDLDLACIKFEIEEGAEGEFSGHLISDNTLFYTTADGIAKQEKMGTYRIEKNDVIVVDEADSSVNFVVRKDKIYIIDSSYTNGKTVELIPFLDKCYKTINEFSNNVYKQLP